MANLPDVEIIDCAQNSDAWLQARAGVVTASEFHTVLAKGRGGAPSETRKKLLAIKAAEILTGGPVQVWGGNEHTERGHALEQEIRDLYEATSDEQLTQVGFMRRGRIGYSPDGLVGEHGLFEAKSCLPHIQIARLEAGTLPSEHLAQCQGGLLVSGRHWIDYRSYSPGLPQLRVRVQRDLVYLSNLNTELQIFIRELDQLVEKIRRMS